MLVQSHHNPTIFDTLAEEWTALLHRSAADTVFLTPAYQRAWWHNLGTGDLHVVTVREHEELVGIAPLFAVERDVEGRVLQTVGCVEVSDYLDLVCAPGREAEVLRALLDFLSGTDGPQWDLMDLCNIHRDSPTLHLLPSLALERGWRSQSEVQEVCPVVQLPGTWEEYLAGLDRKQRREVRRKVRRAEAVEGLRTFTVGPEHDLHAEVDAFLELMAKSSPEKAAFLDTPMRAFFHEVARAASDAGWLQLAFLELQGQRLASYLHFIYDNQVLVYNSGLDWEADPGLSAGIVLTAHLIRQAIEEGRAAYDFLRGGEQYKYRLGGRDVTVHRLILEREG